MIKTSLLTLILCGCSDERYYTDKFVSTRGVTSVEKYFNYENHRFADLIIQKSGRLKITDFDEDIFSSTQLIFLKRIGNFSVKCTDEKRIRNIVNAFNFIDYINDYTTLSRVNNIGDIVGLYDKLYENISDLAKAGTYTKYFFQPTSLDYGKRFVWCKFKPFQNPVRNAD